jgi:hypothetical protein
MTERQECAASVPAPVMVCLVYPQRTPFGFGTGDWDEPLVHENKSFVPTFIAPSGGYLPRLSPVTLSNAPQVRRV